MVKKLTGANSVDSSEVEGPGETTADFEERFLQGTSGGVEVDIVSAKSGGGGDKKQFDELKFNEDFVEVMLHESTDENAENPVFTACNGVTQYFFRGQPQQVRRKFVAILASCKEHSLKTEEYTAADGSRGIRLRSASSLKYPFSVISDPAGKRGADWLKSLLKAPT